jgi:hypothetical protein
MQRQAFLRSRAALPGGMGAIVFFAKNGEADEWSTSAGGWVQVKRDKGHYRACRI